MKIFKTLSLFFSFLIIGNTFAAQEFSMRDCALLPITGNLDAQSANTYFTSLETYLLQEKWCNYKLNLEATSVFDLYKNNLNEHLQNPDVLALFAEKTQAGSLIRIDIKLELGQVLVSLGIIGGNGRDLYYSNSVVLPLESASQSLSMIKTWLKEYSDIIPYHTRVKFVQGKDIIIDSSIKQIPVGSKLAVYKVVRKKEHPLLKEVVDWDTQKIASAEIVESGNIESIAEINSIELDSQIQAGDWITFEVIKDNLGNDHYLGERNNKKPRLGHIGINALFGQRDYKVRGIVQDSLRTADFIKGLGFDSELWITRNYILKIDVATVLNKAKKIEGDLKEPESTVADLNWSLSFGRRFLPLDYFYGPRIDIFLGYRKLTFKMDDFPEMSATAVDFSIFSFLARLDLPIDASWRFLTSFEYGLRSKHDVEEGSYWLKGDSSFYDLKLGFIYNLSSETFIDCILKFEEAKISFEKTDRKAIVSTHGIRLGFNVIF